MRRKKNEKNERPKRIVTAVLASALMVSTAALFAGCGVELIPEHPEAAVPQKVL